MKKFIVAFMLGMGGIGLINNISPNNAYAISDSDIDKILKAKEIVRGMVNYPDTLVFHDMYTEVHFDSVTLKFTAKNGFGVPETHTMKIKVK